MRLFPSLAPIALLAVAVTACDSEPEPMSEEAIEQVLQAWTEPSEAPPEPEQVDLLTATGSPVPLPPMAPKPEQLSDRFLVILSSSKRARTMPASLAILAEHPPLIDPVVRASSSWFEGLMPCYEVTLAGAFEYRRQATALARQLEGLGVENYVKQAGRYLGPQAVVEAWCQADHQALTEGCGQALFAEVHDGKAWLRLAQDPIVVERALQGSPDPEPLGGLEAWSASLPVETIDPHREGDAWKLYAPASAQTLGRCKVKSFEAITRGQPHFGYLRQDPPPTSPGCGSPELFARLDCKEPPQEPLLALPADHPEPVLYTALAPLRDIELEDDVKVIVNRSPAFAKSFQQARTAAEERSMPLQQLVSLRGFVGPKHKLLLVQVTLQTGDGLVWCGSDDVRHDLAAVFEWTTEGGIGAELVPFHPLEMAEVLGLIDVDADGVPELFQLRWPGEYQLVFGGAEQVCSAPQDYCDCPC